MRESKNNICKPAVKAARAFFAAAAFCALFGTALFSCSFFNADSPSETGSITMNLPSAEEISAASGGSISGAVTSSGAISDTAVKTFKVRAKSASTGVETVQSVAPGSTVNISPLGPGFWSVTLFGNNADGQTIYYGKSDGILVSAGRTTPAAVVINPVDPNTQLTVSLKETQAALPAQGRANVTSAYVSVNAEGQTKSAFYEFSNADATRQPQDDNKITVVIPSFFEPGTTASAKVYLFGTDGQTGNGQTAYWGGTVSGLVKTDGKLEAELNSLNSSLVESNYSVNKLDVKMDKELDSQLTGGSGMGYEFAVKTGDATAPVSSGLKFFSAIADVCGEVPLIVEYEGMAWCDIFTYKHPVVLPTVTVPDQFPIGVSKAFQEKLSPAAPKEWPKCDKADAYDDYGYKQYAVQGAHTDDWKGIEFASPSGGVMANHYYTPSGAGATPTHAQTVNTDSDTCTWTKTIESKNYGYFEDGSIDVKELSGSFTVTGAAWTVSPAAIEVEKGGTFSFTLTNAAANEADCQAVAADLNFKVIPGTSSSGTAVTTTQTAKGSSVVVAVTAPASWSAGSSKALSVWLGTTSALGSDDSGVKTFTVNVTAASSGGGGSGGSGNIPTTYGDFVQKPFSVSATKQVYFSPGNLWYQASDTGLAGGTSTFKFAEKQYDIVGKAGNEAVSATYDGWIDLFPWGTSGYKPAYQPYTRGSDYNETGMHVPSMTGEYANLDWGVYNPISNGGNQAGLWRTLTSDEWDYLLHKRSVAFKMRAPARVNGIAGIVLLPDDWTTTPAGLTFNTTYSGTVPSGNDIYVYETNTYSAAEWSQMEAQGAVFLPSTGTCYDDGSWEYENGSSTVTNKYIGIRYWTATAKSSGNDTKYALYTTNGGYNGGTIETTTNPSGKRPASVRLAQDAPTYTAITPTHQTEYYVASYGTSGGDGTEDSPLNSIASAITKIKANEEGADYTIYIDGQLTGSQQISGITMPYAKSITIKGKNGEKPGTGIPQDSLKGNFTSSSRGTVLTIGTEVPIIIKDLMITGGYKQNSYYYYGSGIAVGNNSFSGNDVHCDVTLGSGCLVTGNKSSDTYGAGVGVWQYAKLTIDGASITNNTIEAQNGGQGVGVYFGGTNLVIKGDSVISGNSCKYNGTDVADSGYSAVYCYSSDAVIEGNAQISDNDVTGIRFMGGNVSIRGNAQICRNISHTNSTDQDKTGGGMFIRDSNVTISENVQIIGNKASRGGGISLYAERDYASLKLFGGLIQGNTATSGVASAMDVYTAIQGYPSVFVGKSAKIDTDNQIFLYQYSYITIESDLSEPFVTQIRVNSGASDGLKVFAGEGDLIKNNKDKFNVFNVVSEVVKNWVINDNGTISAAP